MPDTQPTSSDQLPSLAGFKNCSACGKLKPADPEFFVRNKHSPDGLHNECKTCRIERTKKSRKESDELVLAEIDAIRTRAVDNLAGYVGSRPQGGEIPTESEMLEELTAVMGGSSFVAAQMYADLLASPPGSKQRMQWYQLYLKLLANVQAAGENSRDLEKLDYDSLVALLTRIVKAGALRTVVEGHIEPPADLTDG